MPNWCTNTLLISGEPDEVQKLLDTVEDGNSSLSLSKLITTPEELKNTTAPSRNPEEEKQRLRDLYGAVDWYDWQVNNWGTKWDVEARIIGDTHANVNVSFLSKVKETKRVVTMEFDSAWAPPTPVIKHMAKQFPNTNIYHTYDESGSDFSGYHMYSNGECVKEQETESFSNLKFYYEPSEDIFDYFPDNE
jgi:hypothetical protein